MSDFWIQMASDKAISDLRTRAFNMTIAEAFSVGEKAWQAEGKKLGEHREIEPAIKSVMTSRDGASAFFFATDVLRLLYRLKTRDAYEAYLKQKEVDWQMISVCLYLRFGLGEGLGAIPCTLAKHVLSDPALSGLRNNRDKYFRGFEMAGYINLIPLNDKDNKGQKAFTLTEKWKEIESLVESLETMEPADLNDLISSFEIKRITSSK